MKQETNESTGLREHSRYVEEDKKTKEWGIGLINNVIALAGSETPYWNSLRINAVNNFERYAGVSNEKEIQYLIKPHGERINTPYRRFPLGRSRIDSVTAEFQLTPPQRYAMCIDKKAIDERENYKAQMTIRKATAEMDAEIERLIGKQIEYNKDIPLTENIDEFFKKGNYKEIWADQINTGIDYLFNVRNLMERIVQALRNHLITGRPMFELRVESGDPMPRVIDPRTCIYELGSSTDYLDDCQWFYYEYWATVGEIWNEYRHCPEFQRNKGKELLRKLEALSAGSGNTTAIPFNTGRMTPEYFVNRTPETGAVIKVCRYLWQSSKTMSVKKSVKRDGTPLIVQIDPAARVKKYEEKMTKTMDQPWGITCLGGIEYLDFGPLDNYTKDVDVPGRNPLPIIGLHMGKTDGFTSSMQDLLNPIDEMHDEVMFHIRSTIAKAGGKAIIYDISQMPRKFNKSIQKVAHHMKQDGIIAIDLSKINEETAGGLGSNFNQWKEVDMSLSQGMTHLINLRGMLEQMADDISGVNDNRRGNIGQYETATNSEQSIARSATRTEFYLYPFNQLLKRLYERLADMMKVTWKEGKSYAFWNPDGAQVMMKILPDIGLHNYGFYVGSNTLDRQHKRQIEMLMSQLSSNTQDPDLLLSMLRVIKADYADEAEQVFESAIEVMKKNMQAQQEQEAAQAERLAGLKEQELQDKKDLEEAKLQNNIDVANIQVGGKVVVADILTDQVEMNNRTKILSDTAKAGGKDSGSDSAAEGAGKKRISQMAKNQI